MTFSTRKSSPRLKHHQRTLFKTHQSSWQLLRHYCLSPRLETLEDRTLLAALTVDTAEDIVDGDVSSITALTDTPGDDGKISLREAILATNVTVGEDAILFDESINGTPILFGIEGKDDDDSITGDLDITDDLNLVGNGSELTIIDANHLDRVVEIHSGSVEIESVTVRGGEGVNEGGGIRNLSVLSIASSHLSDNRSKYMGGGLFNSKEAVILQIHDSSITGNVAAYNLDDLPRRNNFGGGGILNQGLITRISNSSVDGNVTNRVGGGINNYFEGTINDINSSNISENVAHEGGGVWNRGLLKIISESVISGNTGSGIFVLQHGEIRTIITSEISGNSATIGGGILNEGTILNLSRNLIARNEASALGGGIYNGFVGSIELISQNTISCKSQLKSAAPCGEELQLKSSAHRCAVL